MQQLARDEAGNVWVVDEQGNPIALHQPAQSEGVFIPDPTAQYEEPQAQADIQGAQIRNQGSAIQNQVTAGTAPTTIQTNQAPAGFMWIDPNDPQKGVVPIPGYAPPKAASEVLDPQKLGNLRALSNLLNELEAAYKEGPGATGGLGALGDYFPTEANDRFNTLAASLGDVGFAAFRVPGSGVQTDADQKRFIDANTPSTWDRDTQIETKIKNVRNRLNETVKGYGFDPEAFSMGEMRPLGSQTPKQPEREQSRLPIMPPTPWDIMRGDGGRGAQTSAAGWDATTTVDYSYAPEGQAAHAELIAQIMQNNNGRLDPQAYARGRAELDKKYSPEGTAPNIPGYLKWANDINAYLDAGGRTIPMGVPSPEREMTTSEWLHNKAVSNPVGAAAVGALNMGGFGGVEALAPEQYQALRESQPISTLGGEIGGAILGTGALAKAGQETIGRAVPHLLGGGSKAQFGRNLGTDVAYSGIYGGVTGRDPIETAALGGGGSVIGQTLGKGVGATFRGAQTSDAVQALKQSGVGMSVGRQLGDWSRRAEDLMTSIPIVGGRVRARQQESLSDFNRAMLNEGGSPIGFQPTAVGAEGVEQLQGAVSSAYRNALGDTRIPIDEQFLDDFAAAIPTNLPADKARPLGQLLDARVQNIADQGFITGRDFQSAMRALKANRAKPPSKYEGYEQEFRDAATGVMNALESQIMRGGGSGVISKLNAANAANRNLKILEDAALDRAKIGTQAGEINIFTPAQLLGAARKSEKRFGPTPMTQLARQGQEVLPSTVPNSGTTDRALAATALGGLGIGGIGLGETYATGDPSNTMKVLSLGAMLALLGTKKGQKGLENVLINRPDAARKIGEAINRRKGIFGAAATAPAIQSQ